MIRCRSVVHRNDFYHIEKVVADFDDFTKEYFVSRHGLRVGIVVLKDDRVLLVRQYRFLLEGLSWEIPGGGTKDGETPVEAAVRECSEETGLACKNLVPLVRFNQGLDAVDNFTHVFFTDTFTEPAGFTPDPKEAVEQVWVPWEECLKKIFSGEIADSFTIASLLSYRTFMQAKGN